MMKNEFVYVLLGDYESDPYEPTGTDIFGIFSFKEDAGEAFRNFFDKKKKDFLNYFKEMDENNYWWHYPKLPFEKQKFLQDVISIFDNFKFTNDASTDYNELRKLVASFQEGIRDLFLKLEKENSNYWDLFCSPASGLSRVENFFFHYDTVSIEEIAFNKLLDSYRSAS